jgi:hypothetical protein
LCYIGCKGSQNNNNKTQYDGPRFIAQINNMAIIVVLPKEIKILETCNMVMATMLLHIITKFSKKTTYTMQWPSNNHQMWLPIFKNNMHHKLLQPQFGNNIHVKKNSKVHIV